MDRRLENEERNSTRQSSKPEEVNNHQVQAHSPVSRATSSQAEMAVHESLNYASSEHVLLQAALLAALCQQQQTPDGQQHNGLHQTNQPERIQHNPMHFPSTQTHQDTLFQGLPYLFHTFSQFGAGVNDVHPPQPMSVSSHPMAGYSQIQGTHTIASQSATSPLMASSLDEQPDVAPVDRKPEDEDDTKPPARKRQREYQDYVDDDVDFPEDSFQGRLKQKVSEASMEPPDEWCAPCRRRGMPKIHNIKTAHFIISKHTKHGDNLICSFPECNKDGPRFRFCAVCQSPVALNNFTTRHNHHPSEFGTPKTISELVASAHTRSRSTGTKSWTLDVIRTSRETARRSPREGAHAGSSGDEGDDSSASTMRGD